METRSRKIFHDYIDIIRASSDIELKKNIYCAQFFMHKIDDIYSALNSPAMLQILRGNVSVEIKSIERHVKHSMIYALIIFTSSLLEIIDNNFLKSHPIYLLRNKLAHGKENAPLNYKSWKPVDFEGNEFNSLIGTDFKRGKTNKNLISLLWHIRQDDGSFIYKIDSQVYNDQTEARRKLYEVLEVSDEAVVICRSGNFASNIDKLYDLVCEKTESYLVNNLDIKNAPKTSTQHP
nr:hypothetical protein [Bacteroidota bacterium]